MPTHRTNRCATYLVRATHVAVSAPRCQRCVQLVLDFLVRTGVLVRGPVLIVDGGFVGAAIRGLVWRVVGLLMVSVRYDSGPSTWVGGGATVCPCGGVPES